MKTNVQRIDLLKDYGITEKKEVMEVLGISEKAFDKAMLKNTNCYNGLFDENTVCSPIWLKKNNKNRYGYSLKEKYIIPFIKANKGRYTIQQISKMVMFGGSKIPIIIMKNNLGGYMRTKEKDCSFVPYETAIKRMESFKKYKNDKSVTMYVLSDIIGSSMDFIERAKVRENFVF